MKCTLCGDRGHIKGKDCPECGWAATGKKGLHSPGPWTMTGDTERDGLPSRLIHGRPVDGMLAIVRTGHQGGYFGPANARLIAAAPELLEALEALLDWHTADVPKNTVMGCLKMAFDAIAKARGK